MKKNYLYLLIPMLFSACKKDFLDRQPKNAYSNSSLWTSEKDANAVLNGVYNGWYKASAVIYLDCASDNGYSQYSWEEYQPYGNGTATPSAQVSSYFDYGTITRANFFLANIDKAPINDKVKANMKAQARFLRAFRYFLMSQLYGDVPLVTTVLTPEESLSIAKTPKVDIIKFILSELTAAAADLPQIKNAGDGHISKGAALALKARVELFNGDYAACIKDCEAVMQMGYQLYPSYVDLFRMVAQTNNSEIIAALQHVENPSDNATWVLGVMPTTSAGGWSSINPLQSLVDAYEMKNGKPISDPTSGYNPVSPYTNRDPRLAATILYPGASFIKNDKSAAYYDPMTTTSEDYYARRNNTSPSAYVVNKYTSNLSDFADVFQTGINMPVIRYAEVLLTHAEAKIESNQIDASVYQDLNLVRNRAGMPSVDQTVYSNATSLRTLVRNERRVEFAFEGLRFFDIQRWKIGPQTMNGQTYGAKIGTVDKNTGVYVVTGEALKIENRIFADKNYLWPILQEQIDRNKNIKQNPGY